MIRLVCILGVLSGPALADSVVATRAIQPKEKITEQDVTLVAMDIPGAMTDAALVIGQEARVAISAGHAVTSDDLARLTLVERNALVSMSFVVGGLEIITEGRALDRGAQGDVIDIMNMSSHTRLRGRVAADGSVIVEQGSGS